MKDSRISLPALADLNRVDEYEYDLVDVVQLTNDGQTLTGVAVLCDLGGGLVRVNFTHRRSSPQAAIFPDASVPASAIQWLEWHGLVDLTNDACEAMAEQRDVLKDKDVQSGPNIGFVWTDREAS